MEVLEEQELHQKIILGLVEEVELVDILGMVVFGVPLLVLKMVQVVLAVLVEEIIQQLELLVVEVV
jgi:hypothetical protein